MDNNIIVNALRNVKNPTNGIDIITSKMIEDFKIQGESIFFTLILPGNDGQLKSSLHEACMSAIVAFYPNADVNIHFKSKHDDGTSNSALPQVKNVIAVASGKGGVGKSTVSVNLAVALSKLGYKVGIIDADLYGPSIPTMLGIHGQRPKVELLYGKHKIIPIQAHGLHIISIGLIVEPEQAVVLRGPRLAGLIKQFVSECLWPELDYIVVDLPPGTGDVQLTLVQTVPLTGVVMVTTPQDVAVIDAVKAMNMFLLDNVNVPILGVVENMSWFTPEELPQNKYYLFGQGGGQKLASSADVPLLGQLPIVQNVRESGDAGSPVAMDQNSIMGNMFKNLAISVTQLVDNRNANHAPTKIVEISQ
ncbi:MAG: Mrp/NBP35 family ATP-binding protein [Saprospiraceae bacterium]